jgi:hypothetical protein
VLLYLGFGVGQPGGAALLVLAVLTAITGWGMASGARWRRYLGILMMIATGGAGAYGVYGLVVLVAQSSNWSRVNIAVLAVLLLMGITSVVLLAALVGAKYSAEDAIGLAPRRQAVLMAFGFVIGVGASVLFSAWLSTLVEPPCCPALTADPAVGILPR